MIKVGLTGSISVGKTFACECFSSLGIPVLDADITAREVVLPGTLGWQKVVDFFGEDILLEDNKINRAKLGSIIFTDSEKREVLNSIVHPLVIEAQNEWLTEQESKHNRKVAIIDAALMIESGFHKTFDKLIVIWCEEEIQINRLMKRNNLNKEDAVLRIRSQMSQEEKKKYADYLINTSTGFDATKEQIKSIVEVLNNLGE